MKVVRLMSFWFYWVLMSRCHSCSFAYVIDGYNAFSSFGWLLLHEEGGGRADNPKSTHETHENYGSSTEEQNPEKRQPPVSRAEGGFDWGSHSDLEGTRQIRTQQINLCRIKSK